MFVQYIIIGGCWQENLLFECFRTNLPKELMEYADFSYEEKGKSFLNQPEVLEYMQNFAKHYNLYPHIKVK